MISQLPTIAQHAKQHGINPLKSLGQNFLFDFSLCQKIARTAKIQENDIVIEIGPGTAGLTRAILENNPQKLIVLEKDQRCISLLEEIKTIYTNLEIMECDALQISVKEILKLQNLDPNTKVKILANLPYNIATTLILNWYKELENIEIINVMVQKEVAERISSIHGNKIYGRLSVISQLLTNTSILFDVSPDAFYPKPKIWSSIISLKPMKNRPSRKEIEKLEQITAASFNMRRKMLRSSLKQVVPSSIMETLDINLRAENLAPNDYLEIVRKLYKDPKLNCADAI